VHVQSVADNGGEYGRHHYVMSLSLGDMAGGVCYYIVPRTLFRQVMDDIDQSLSLILFSMVY